MTEESAFLAAILDAPHDWGPRLVYADWLEERGDPRAESIRLLHELLRPEPVSDRPAKEARLRELQEAGVKPVGPFWSPEKLVDLGMKFSLIPPGTFLMGSPNTEAGRSDDEGPQHRVTITRGFLMGIHPVTQEQWRAVMDNNPSHFTAANLPVEQVSWDDCQAFCRQLAMLCGRPVRLPTEAEWEYACRAGTTTPFHFGGVLDGTQANCDGNYPYGTQKKGAYRQATTPTGSYTPNDFGLYDMHGNVWEWCEDFYGSYQIVSAMTDPIQLVKQGIFGRVLRGGSWLDGAGFCRAAYRRGYAPGVRRSSIGFRVCLPWTDT